MFSSFNSNYENFEKAEKFYNQAITDNKSQRGNSPLPIAHLNLGEVFGKTARIPKAIKEWELAIQQDPSLLPAQFNLGIAFMMQGKLDNAENYFLKCLELNSRFKPALFNLALVKQKQFQIWARVILKIVNIYLLIEFSKIILEM